MKIDNIKTIGLVAVVATQLVVGSAYAAHELESKSTAPVKKTAPVEVGDGHISWHEFRHDLMSYSRVIARIDHHGVITLSGNVDNSTEIVAVEQLASKVRGATDIKSLVRNK